jgi:hypothetical protein
LSRSDEDKERLMECIGNVLAGEVRILYGSRVKIIAINYRYFLVIEIFYKYTFSLVVNRIHDIRRII